MQYINLYPIELRPTQEWLTCRSLALVVLGLIGLLFFSYVRIDVHQKRIEQSVIAMESQYVAATERIDRIKSGANPSTTKNLEEIALVLRQKISQRRGLSRIIESQNLGNEQGFSQALSDIARHSFSSVSIDRIRIDTDKKLVEMDGLCRIPKDVAKYIDVLSKTPTFSSMKFGSLSMTQVDQKRVDKNLHKFSVGFDSVYLIAEDNQ